MPAPFQKIALATWPTGQSAEMNLSALAKWLQDNGFETALDKGAAEGAGLPGGMAREAAVVGADLVIVIGGDGSMLRTAQLLGENAPPLLGVNTGHLGFLADIPATGVIPALERILLKGEYTVESRMRLRPSAQKNGENIPLTDVLNDVVLTSGPLARMVEFQVSIEGRMVGIFRADGLIIATPTGSTAYSLSAGGPLLMPDLNVMLINPICPHTLSNRPLVIPAEATVDVMLFTDYEAEDRSLLLTIDGQPGCELNTNDHLRVGLSPAPVRLVRPVGTDFFQILREKLLWETHPRGTKSD
ncbi:MAG: NAD(+)/NADH kinase [Nitrospinota bacterium]